MNPETAWLFAGALGTTPDFWINLQAAYDLAVSRPARPYGACGTLAEDGARAYTYPGTGTDDE